MHYSSIAIFSNIANVSDFSRVSSWFITVVEKIKIEKEQGKVPKNVC